jgi:hypothetical protein
MTTNYIRFVEPTEEVVSVIEEAKAHNADVWVNWDLHTTVISTTPVYNHVLISAFANKDLS